MAFSQRSWITTASCFKSSNVRSNKDRENNSTIPISDETLHHGKSSFFRKLTSNCLKSPNKVDYATPLNMSSQIFLSRAGCSPKPCRSEEKGRPNSSKTHSSIELPRLGVSGKISERNSYLTHCKGDKINHQVYSKDKSKHRVKDVIRDDKAYPKGSDPNLASLKSESNLNLCRVFNGFYPRRSLPQDQTVKRSPKNASSRDAEVKFSAAEKTVCAEPIEPTKRSPVNAEQVLKPVFCDALAEAIRSDDAKSTVLVDCRTFVIYNNNHIIGALNISCSDCITRKRLLCGRIHVVDLVSGTEDAKLRFKESLENENIKLVLYDEDTRDASSLPKTHPLKVISSSISKVKKRICYLKGD